MAKRGTWARAQRWTEREARAALGALAESGESLASFAEREGLSAAKLYRWRARLSEPAFVELRPEPRRTEESGVLEVVVGGGRVVRVPADFDADVLRRLLAVLEGGAC